MNPEAFQPGYIARGEEQVVKAEAARVRETGQSRALLVYGPGGVGKTSLVRALARLSDGDPGYRWLDPVDVDDPEYWLLATLERSVARQLDPGNEYFGPYLDYVSRLPGAGGSYINRQTVVSHLGRIKRVFVDCYANYVTTTGNTVIMSLDTVEALRGVYLLYTLTQWMKSLPGTLFILSGRPMVVPGDRPDPIKDELQDEHQSIPITELRLGPFDLESARQYLHGSEIGGSLSTDEIDVLALLTRGHPLWLAFTVSYAGEVGIPAEARVELADLQRVMPYDAELSREGRQLNDAFRRRLVAPYRNDDFWREAVKRLAVVRQGISRPIWDRLMSDRLTADQPRPAGAKTPDDAWRTLSETPWVRTRASGQYVTLHDAVAEELSQRLIPLHDSDQRWRKDLWARAAAIYAEVIREQSGAYAAERTRTERLFQARADETTRTTGDFPAPQAGQTGSPDAAAGDRPTRAEDEGRLIERVVRLDARGHELDQLRVTQFHYQLLSSFEVGAEQFVTLFGQAKHDYDVFFQDRLALEMQRFLPGTEYAYPLGDVIASVLTDFHDWLDGPGRATYLEIGMVLGGYLIDNAHPNTAITLLDRLPADIADSVQRTRLEILKANAYLRVPEMMWEAVPCLDRALAAADSVAERDRRHAAVAEVNKERGYFFRNMGRWHEAGEAYGAARDAILENFAMRDSDSDREDMASIQTNWAYLLGLRGDYGNGLMLVDRAVEERRRRNLLVQEGISLSVRGEILRYQRRFSEAWESYAEAEAIFQGNYDWSWLGLIYQEQAICLVQAMEVSIDLVPGKNPAEQAERLITLALDICRDQNPRAYPSALNRAGRIYGAGNVDAGLEFLTEAIDQASRLSDGWFWCASLLEYVELSYRVWAATGRADLRAAIEARREAGTQALNSYDFVDLQGRWHIVVGHLALHDYLDGGPPHLLDSARDNYREGFRLLAMGQFGSSGVSSVESRFSQFGTLFARLPREVRTRWLGDLRSSWRSVGGGSVTLLACLEQLY